jgi:beta-lactamase regulating signal transducer with metallopeptidase domain/HEAT repeat protein
MPLLLILLKVTLLLIAALAVTIVMQRASAGSRHLVWLVALAALLLVPLLATWGPIHWRVLPGSLSSPTTLIDDASLHGSAGEKHAARVPPPPTFVSVPGTPRVDAPVSAARPGLVALLLDHLATTLFVTWLAVTLMLLTWLAYGAWSVRRIVRRAALLEDPDWQQPLYEIADRLSLDLAPRLVRSEDVKMPFACGLVHCTIVLPAECDGWSAERRSAVLIHELGHVRRHDLIGHTLGRFACALYWFHPMVWTAARRLRAESERACDDLALRFGARPSDYAEHLLDIVTCVRDHATPAVALAMAHRKEFEGRMLAILNPDLRRTAFSRIQTASLVGVLTLLSLVVSAAAPAPRTVPAVEPSAGNQHGLAALPGAQPDTQASGSIVAGGRTHVHVRTDTRTKLRIDTRISTALAEAFHSTDAPVLKGDSTARAALLMQLLRTDTAADVRRIAAWGLSQYDDQAAVHRALIVALAGDADDRVREMAAWTLGNSDGQGDTPALTTAALGDRSEEVRETATWALANHGEPPSASVVAKILASDRSELVRGTAVWAMGQFNLDAAPKALLVALTDSNEEVRFKAAWATSQIGDSMALPAVRAALRHETSVRVQRVQLRALIHCGEDPEKMVEWLKSPDAGVRGMAVRALAGGESSGPWPWPWPRPRPQP